MPFSVGGKLGHYEVVSLLGQSGMGEVHRANDTVFVLGKAFNLPRPVSAVGMLRLPCGRRSPCPDERAGA